MSDVGAGERPQQAQHRTDFKEGSPFRARASLTGHSQGVAVSPPIRNVASRREALINSTL